MISLRHTSDHPAAETVSGACPTCARQPFRRAFTILEIMMVLSLMGLLAVVMVGGASTLLKMGSEEDPEDALLTLLQDVRRDAVVQGQIMVLQPVDKGVSYMWGDNHLRDMPVLEGVQATLIKPERDSNSVLIGGSITETPMDQMRFYPDGTCDPARLEIKRGKNRHVMTIDPWTCAPLPEEESK